MVLIYWSTFLVHFTMLAPNGQEDEMRCLNVEISLPLRRIPTQLQSSKMR